MEQCHHLQTGTTLEDLDRAVCDVFRADTAMDPLLQEWKRRDPSFATAVVCARVIAFAGTPPLAAVGEGEMR
jgi:hypothetical protein